ncbi:phage major capsid protein [Lactobacillus gasseri]|jgi:phage major capsid protein, HK97 family|uniref:phage major capsid protein n=1 Tax=Lactobacillus gasseri TaxID=1596 RepID=UPI0022ABF914|nr:phage major capsid protein [Lactobacillus gasseri]MCZ3526079.1 phage major capsid protein [Lactobacillus gasseri]MCZ3553775.1 phage major capsid protein [Lactobacillus gasseri]MCZ3580601.1 phage major capsid protein [Lactobacillus gasseri]MCZ3582387.1 phage major capsid protein [Lactobacillus gasseri]MCZ3584174.1 phage major capsid protein [Lactobacillus gasseri]
MSKITELQEKRARIWKQAKDFLNAKQKESDVLSAEDNARYEKMEQEVVDLGKEINRRHKQAEIEVALNQPTCKALTNSPTADQLPKRQDAHAKDFWKMMRGHAVVDALKEGADPDGGFLVPDEFENQLIQKLQEANVLRTISHVIQTNSGEHKIPVVASEGTAAWLEEEAAYTESNTQFSQVSLGAHKLGTLIKVSEELLNDSAFDLMSYLSDEFGRRLGNAEEQAFLTGTGQPTGILTDTNGASAGSTAAKADALTFDDLIDLFYSLKAPYRQNAVFLMNDDTVKAIRKMKDKNDQYIWQPSVQVGQPDRILNCPVYTSPFMPTLAAANKPVLFGDFNYYWIADREGRTFKRLNELYAVTGQVGFLGSQRVDGKVILPEAIKTLSMAAK